MKTNYLLFLLALPVAHAAAQPTVTSIGGLGPDKNSYALAVSRDGRVVVGYGVESDTQERSVRWENGQLTAIDGSVPANHPIYVHSLGWTTNHDGSAVFGFDYTTNGSGYRWTKNGGGASLGLTPNFRRPFPHATNADGTVATGGFEVPNHGPLMRWTAAGGVQEIGEYPNAFDTIGRAISEDGTQIVGNASWFNTRIVWRWTQGAGFQQIAPPAGYLRWMVHTSAGNLSVLAGSAELPGNGPTVPVVRSASGVFTVIPMIAPHNFGEVRGVSTDGKVAAGMSMPNGLNNAPPSLGWIWTPDLGVWEIGSFIRHTGGSTEGWTAFHESNGVSADGRTIVGTGMYNNRFRGWVLRLPLCPADVGMAGGTAGHDYILDNNDFCAFISMFFNGDARVDIGSAGGFEGADGRFDNNDFIAFINRFFAGCTM